MSAQRPVVAVAAVGRATFDTALADAEAERAFARLDALPVTWRGQRRVLYDAQALEAALPELTAEPVDVLLVLQVTFTDAANTLRLADDVAAPIALWGLPEPRTGGRLRLNALCGINLAGHALAKAGQRYSYCYADPDDPAVGDWLAAYAAGQRAAITAPDGTVPAMPDGPLPESAQAARDQLARGRVAVIGDHPPGFTTCAYDSGRVSAALGCTLEPVGLETVFSAADGVSQERVDTLEAETRDKLAGVETLDRDATRGTLAAYAGMRDLAEAQGWDGLAVRCWPEFFNDRGCAACGAMARLGEEGRPCGCEADAVGTVTTLMLQAMAGEPAFMADLVHADAQDDTLVFWHCGLAPESWHDPEQELGATVHSNRGKPLLNAFPLRPGRVTLARLSQTTGQLRLVVGGGEMLRRPPSFSGTSGVVQPDGAVGAFLDSVMREGLEHHYAIVYGDHREALRALAASLALPLVSLDTPASATSPGGGRA